MTSNITPPTPHFTTPQLASSTVAFTSQPLSTLPTSTSEFPRSSSVAPPETLVKICLLWTVLHQSVSLPPACRGVIPKEKVEELRAKGQYGNVLNHINGQRMENAIYRPERKFDREDRLRYTSRSLSVIGVLGGIVLILLLVAFSTCIKNRRNIILEHQTNGHERFARQILIDHIRHLSSSRRVNGNSATPNLANDTPPAYDEVVKAPPAGEENQAGNRDANPGSESDGELPSYVEAIEAAGGGDSHVVTIEAEAGAADRGMAAANAVAMANPNFVEPVPEELSTPRTKRRLLFGKFSSSERIEMAPSSGRSSPVTSPRNSN